MVSQTWFGFRTLYCTLLTIFGGPSNSELLALLHYHSTGWQIYSLRLWNNTHTLAFYRLTRETLKRATALRLGILKSSISVKWTLVSVRSHFHKVIILFICITGIFFFCKSWKWWKCQNGLLYYFSALFNEWRHANGCKSLEISNTIFLLCAFFACPIEIKTIYNVIQKTITRKFFSSVYAKANLKHR